MYAFRVSFTELGAVEFIQVNQTDSSCQLTSRAWRGGI